MLFHLRHPGVHQSGSGSGQHQRGGCRTLPRHERERRALWVGESRKKKKRNTVIHTPPLITRPRVSFESLTLTHVTCVFLITVFSNLSQLYVRHELSKKKVSKVMREWLCYQCSCIEQMGKPQKDKTRMFPFKSLTVSHFYFFCGFPSIWQTEKLKIEMKLHYWR